MSGEHGIESHRWINLKHRNWLFSSLIATYEFDRKKLGEPGSESIVKLNESSEFKKDSFLASLAGESETRSLNPTDLSLILFMSALMPLVGVLVSGAFSLFIFLILEIWRFKNFARYECEIVWRAEQYTNFKLSGAPKRSQYDSQRKMNFSVSTLSMKIINHLQSSSSSDIFLVSIKRKNNYNLA